MLTRHGWTGEDCTAVEGDRAIHVDGEDHGELLSTKSGCRVVGHTNFISCAILVSVTTGPLGATSLTVIPE
jgi:hypothetical protein